MPVTICDCQLSCMFDRCLMSLDLFKILCTNDIYSILIPDLARKSTIHQRSPLRINTTAGQMIRRVLV
jgi:hypothetical protein